MDKLNNYKAKVNNVLALIDKMEKGELSLSELSQLEQLTREIHERSIILKYKAYESKSTVVKPVQEEVVVEETPIIEEAAIEEKQEEAAPSFDLFGGGEAVNEEEPEAPLFDFSASETTEEPAVEEIPTSTPVENTLEQEKAEENSYTAPSIEERTEPIVEATNTATTSFVDRLSIPDDSLSTQFSMGSIDSLVGAFGFNDRLRFINDLFDGSSDSFGDAVKALDNQVSFDAAKQKVEELAVNHSWDPEEDVVVEFMTLIKRRYA